MKNIIFAIGALAAVVVVYLLAPGINNKQNLFLEEKPEFFMTEFIQYDTNEQGVIDKKTMGTKIDIYDKKDYSFIESPVITVTKKDGLEFKLKAANGQKFSQDKILLSGGVHVTNNLPTFIETMQTAELWLYPNINFAETEKKVAISRNASTTRGTGAKFHIDVNKVELLSDATTIYNIE